MIWEITIFLAIVGIFIIIARKLPDLNKNIPSRDGISDFLFNNYHEKDKTREDILNNATQTPSLVDQELTQQEFDKAERKLLEEISENPNQGKLYNQLGIIYLNQKNYSDALEAFKESIKHEKKAGRFYNIALANIELQKFRDAIDSLEKALELDKNNKKYSNLLNQTRKKIIKIPRSKKY